MYRPILTDFVKKFNICDIIRRCKFLVELVTSHLFALLLSARDPDSPVAKQHGSDLQFPNTVKEVRLFSCNQKTKNTRTPGIFCFLVAELGIAPKSRGYEPLEILLLYPAINAIMRVPIYTRKVLKMQLSICSRIHQKPSYKVRVLALLHYG